MRDFVVRNARVIDPANGVDAVTDLFVAAGCIASMGKPPSGWVGADIDGSRCWLLPGLVDLAARPREPGMEHKATLASETRAAAAAGITTLCCPPDTNPIIDTPAVARLIKERAAEAGHAHVLPLAALTQALDGEHLSEMAALKAAGCVGVGNAYRPLADGLVERRGMEYAATFGLTVHLHPEDPALRDSGVAHEGAVSARLGLAGIPSAAETVAVARKLALAEQTGARIHFARLSTMRAVEMVREAQGRGLPVSADVAAHHLYLTELDVDGYHANCHLRPPLRTQRDRVALRAGIADGTLTAICSDHQPHEADAKLAPFGETESGASGLDTLLALGLRLAEEGLCSLVDAVARLTCGPAAVLGIDAGTLSIGKRADLCLFDPEAEWIVSPETLLSRGHNTPFLGWRMRGRVMRTWLAGDQIFERT